MLEDPDDVDVEVVELLDDFCGVLEAVDDAADFVAVDFVAAGVAAAGLAAATLAVVDRAVDADAEGVATGVAASLPAPETVALVVLGTTSAAASVVVTAARPYDTPAVATRAAAPANTVVRLTRVSSSSRRRAFQGWVMKSSGACPPVTG